MPDIASIIDAALNGTDPVSAAPAAPATPGVTPPASGGLGSLFPTKTSLVWIPDKSGQLVAWIIDQSTGQGTPATDAAGNPLTKPAGSTAAPKTVRDPNTGIIYSENPDGTLTQQTEGSTKPVTPKNTVPGSGTYDYSQANQGSSDPSGPSYSGDVPVDVYGAQTARKNADTTAKNDAAAREIGQQNADTSAANSAENVRQFNIQNAQQQASEAWKQAQATIEQGYKDRQYSLDVAKQKADEAHAQISEWLTQRGQDIQSRGQALNYLGNQSYVSRGQYASLQGAQANLAQTGGVPFTPTPTPPGLGYDPAQLAASLAKQALGSAQQPNQPFSLGQAPSQATGGGFVAPSFEQGGAQTNNPGAPPLALAARR